ncbi:hypothetical protein [Nocardia sp. XZ_19_231]|uniref:hypothetical protein n=1 Tax=Nocardia sp. XZ_19_231 TaxID=2769252 RepID=UPI001890756F|nr:hypothetical protein [Nocardia sp. XZ_19_231]
MKLRSLLPRRHINEVPLLPSIGSDDAFALPSALVPRGTRLKREERLERLLTPTELDLVLHHQL